MITNIPNICSLKQFWCIACHRHITGQLWALSHSALALGSWPTEWILPRTFLALVAKGKETMSCTLALKAFVGRSLVLILQWPKQVPWQHLPSTRPRSQSYHVPEKRLRNIWYLAPMTLDSCRHFTLSWAHMSRFTINAIECTFTQQSLLMLPSFFCLISHRIWLKHHYWPKTFHVQKKYQPCHIFAICHLLVFLRMYFQSVVSLQEIFKPLPTLWGLF